MKPCSWKNYDDELTVRVLRWRRPKLVAALLVALVAAVLCALLTPIVGNFALLFAGGCAVVAFIYAFRLSRLERKLEELDR